MTGNSRPFGRLLTTLAALICAGTSTLALASDTSRCHAIQDSDQRHLCLALGKRESSRCHSIKESDLRYSCLAQTQGDRSRCHSIRARDQREMCLALVSR